MSDRRARVQVRLLGPFACSRGGEPVGVAGRLRSLLAVLAMSADAPVTFERLTDGVWGDDPPAEPRRALQVYVNRLRGMLGTDTIATESSGYRLDIPADDVDALLFVRLAKLAMDSDDGGDRRILVDRALDVWAGEPFEAVTSAVLREVDAPRLLERWLAMVEERFDLLLHDDTGEQVEPLIAELDDLTRRNPLREPLWERLLTALSLAGRGAEALDRYEAVRTHLADELGTDPGPGLQAVYTRLLDTEGAAAPRVPQQLLPDLPRFTGRGAALERMDEVLREASGDTPALIAITGTGGAGKTTLAVHWAHRHRAEFPDGQLYVDLHGFSSQAPLDPSNALEVLLRGLGVDSQAMPDDLSERSALLRTELSERRALLVLDNARDADQVRPLLPGSSSTAIVTSRNQLRGLSARDGVRPVPLEPFDECEARTLLHSTLGSARVAGETEAVREIADLCGRLPLAVAITAERAARIPSLSLTAVADELRDERRRLELLAVGDDDRSDLRAVFELSYRILEAEPARLFRLLSLLPDGSFDVPSAAALVGRPARDVTTMLDGLVGSHLVQQPAFGRFSLHDLLRAYAAERCAKEDGSAPADTAVAQASVWLLGSLNAASEVIRPGRPSLMLPDRAEPGPHRADPPPAARFDSFAEAISWFHQEWPSLRGWVHRVDERGLHDLVWRLVAELCLFLEITEQREDAVVLAETATRCAADVDETEAIYVTRQCAGRAYMRVRRLDEADAALTVGRAAAHDAGHQRAEAALLSSAGAVRRLVGEPADALRLLSNALALHRVSDSGDGSRVAATEAGILANIGGCHYQMHAFDEAIAATRSGLKTARTAGDRWQEATCLNNLTVMLEVAEDYPAAAQTFVEGVRLSEQLRAPTLVFDAHTARGRMLAREGDTKGAVLVWEQALAMLPATDNPHRKEVLGLLEDAQT